MAGRAKGKRAAKAAAPAAAKPVAKKGGDTVLVYSRVGGHSHRVKAELAAYLLGQHDPITGEALYVKGGGDGSVAYAAPAVTEAAYGVPDDAAVSDAIAMAERGGQPKGSTAGPTIPQEARQDRGDREAATHPLAKGERLKKAVSPPKGAVNEAVADRHAESVNLPTAGAVARAMGEGGEDALPDDEVDRLNRQGEE